MASFWTGYALPTAIIIGEILAIIVPLLLLVAYYTYAERKVLAYSQLRKGPNVVGPFGLLQPIADGLKLLMKETVIPSGANRIVFVAAPILTFVLSLDRKSTRLNSSHLVISYAVFCLKKKKKYYHPYVVV